MEIIRSQLDILEDHIRAMPSHDRLQENLVVSGSSIDAASGFAAGPRA
jgi:hypothetical protein